MSNYANPYIYPRLPQGDYQFTPAVKVFEPRESYQDLQNDINAWIMSVIAVPDIRWQMVGIEYSVVSCPQEAPPITPLPRLLNVVASDKDPKDGDPLGFGADPKNTPLYTIPFDWVMDLATFTHTDGSEAGEIDIQINGAPVATLVYTSADSSVHSGLGLSGSAGDTLSAVIEVVGGGNPKAEDVVLAMIIEENITPPPPPPPEPCPVKHSALVSYDIIENI